MLSSNTLEVKLVQEVSENAFELLVKPVRKLVEQKGFPKPTEPQEKTIPKILDGKNVLLVKQKPLSCQY
jgi:superfamily II DNA/RNA helicase